MLRTLLCLPWLMVVSAQAADLPRVIEPFTLIDVRTEKPVSLSTFKERKAAVVIFMGTSCPINNAQIIELIRLHKEYGPKGVVFFGINANHGDSVAVVAKHAREHEIPFPVLKDPKGATADCFGATRTPEAFVLDASNAIVYQGRINDQFQIDVKRLAPSTRELGDAIDAVLATKPVRVAKTAAPGCRISRAPRPKTDARVTFSRDIAPLLQKHCQDCHRPGQAAPMSLLSYDDAANWSETIREVLTDGRMPPWYADPKFGKFSNDRHLPKNVRETILTWVEDGCPKGDEAHMPKPRVFPEGEWQIGTPDRIFTMEEPFQVPAAAPKGGIPYQLFIVDPGLKEDVWIQKAEARAGAPSVVHHILAFIVPPRERIDPQMPSPPFLLGVKNARVLAGTAPGDMPSIHPEGTAVRIPAGSKIVFQMHYTPNGKAQKDRSSVGVVFAKKPPEREVMTLPVFNSRLRIPPGEENHRVDSYFKFKEEGVILNFMPHMHLRGKSFTCNLIAPDGTETTLLSVPRYNFNWQTIYRFQEPIRVPSGATVHCIGIYDNSSKNPNNPDPTVTVRWGDQTWQEMMIGWMDMYYERKPQ